MAQDSQAIIAAQYLHRWQQKFGELKKERGKRMMKTNRKYEEDFCKVVRPLTKTIEPGRLCFVPKEFYGPHNQKLHLASVMEDSFWVVSNILSIVVVRMHKKQESVLRDRVMEEPLVVEMIRKEMLQEKNNWN